MGFKPRDNGVSEHLPNELHGFSTDRVIVFAFCSVLNGSVETSESS